MSSGSVRKVSQHDIQVVQNLIERCLQLYMNQKEVVATLLDQAKIEPGFTELVWQKLEEENQEFFKAYYLRLMVKQQILEFNRLLEQQLRLMQEMRSNGVASMSTSNGSISPLAQNSVCYASEQTTPPVKLENMPQAIGSSLPNAFSNGGSTPHANMHGSIDMAAHMNRINPHHSVLAAQNSNTGMMQGMNGGMLKPESGYSGNSAFMFAADNSFLDARSAIGNTPVTPFSTVESSSQPPNEALIDPVNSSFGILGQIPRNFSLSDLTADFSQDILDSYHGSPFLTTGTDNILDARNQQGDMAGGSSSLSTLRRNH